MIILFIGNNSSGKTTISKKIESYFIENKKATILIKEYDYFLLKYVKILFGDRKLKQSQNFFPCKNKITLTKRILPYLIWIDLILEYLYYKIFHKNKIVIKDRSAYDFLMTWKELNLSNKYIEYLYKNFPKPDLLFYIYVKPDIALERRSVQKRYRNDYDLDFYKDKTKMYYDFCRKNNILIINNNTSVDKAYSEIIYYIELRKKMLKTKTIAISGLDGSGKTTTINNFSELLNKLNIKHRTVHFYYVYIPLKILSFLKINKREDEGDKYKNSINNEIESLKKGKSKRWMWFVITDALIQYYYVKIISFNKVVIFDRFFYDYLISFDFLNVKYSKKLLLKIFPKVDKYFLQIADYEILRKRKPEHTIEFFKQCYGKYNNLAKEQNMIILDSTKNNEEKILKKLLDRI